jgi:hypothetical protein
MPQKDHVLYVLLIVVVLIVLAVVKAPAVVVYPISLFVFESYYQK